MSEPQQPFDARAEREWQLQEHAQRAERAGAADGGDTRAAEYRFVARVLHDPPLAPLPADFARRTAALAEDAADDAVQRSSLRLGLVAAAGVLAAGIGLVGPQWSATFGAALGDSAAASALQWTSAVLACLGLSSLLEHWRRRARPPVR
jgi:hypothetical protein